MLQILPDLKNIFGCFTVPMVPTIPVCLLTEYLSHTPVNSQLPVLDTLLLLSSPPTRRLASSAHRVLSSHGFVRNSIQYTIVV